MIGWCAAFIDIKKNVELGFYTHSTFFTNIIKTYFLP